MNPDLDRLQAYPFERLARLIREAAPDPSRAAINLAIGEPRHRPPGFVAEEVITHLHGLTQYPTTRGGAALREAVSRWLRRRYRLPAASIDPERHVLPVNGTREALFSISQAVVDRGRKPLVMMPNPFYQIYEGAALLAGAEPVYINTTAASRGLPEFDAVTAAQWDRCQLLYLCSPGNPTGAVLGIETLQRLIELAERHDFIIASDECYSEIYYDEAAPPPGLLQAAAAMDNTEYRRCLVFHSLSKRSSVPGLRSGFVAGEARLIERFLRYRSYHGCSMPTHTQAASVAAWDDEEHVRENRALYRDKFDAVIEVLGSVLELECPAGGFYLWPRVPVEDTVFTRELYAREHLTVLPGSFLSRDAGGVNPGNGHVRIALVAPFEECVEAAERMRRVCIALGA